jgi:hypothetical protein
MNIEEITKLIDMGIISREYFLKCLGICVDCDEERMIEIQIEEYDYV